MAILDPESDNLILHIVYDGAPRSGKTESIRALGRLLGRPVDTPREREGRTLYFDWLEYEGGLRLGRPIHCRVVAVPGQARLGRRRSTILSAADVVIFVVDSSPEGYASSLRQFRNLQRQLEARDRKIPVFIQLNKRDVEGALDPSVILNNLGAGFQRTHVATVATEGNGIRETFVFAVGEALRYLDEAGELYKKGNEFSTREVCLPKPDQLVKILADLDRPRLPGAETLEDALDVLGEEGAATVEDSDQEEVACSRRAS